MPIVAPAAIFLEVGAKVEPGDGGSGGGFTPDDLRGLAQRDVNGVLAHADFDLAGINGESLLGGEGVVAAESFLFATADAGGGATSEQQAGEEN